MSRYLVLFSSLLVAAPATAEWDDWLAAAQAGVTHQSNVNHARKPNEQLEDTAFGLQAQFGRIYQLSNLSKVYLRGLVDADFYTQYSQLTAVMPGVEAAFEHKLGIGSNVPWYQVFVSAHYHDAGTRVRDYMQLRSGVTFGKRFSEQWTGTVRYTYQQRWGSSGPVWNPLLSSRVSNQVAHIVNAQLNYQVLPDLTLSAGYHFQRGDFTSSSHPDPELRGRAIAVTNDSETFGGVLCNWCVYRLEGDTHSGFVNASYALNEQTAFNLRYTLSESSFDEWSYRDHLFQANLVWRY